jgi:menaquinone-dependent protoporphyrinogen oxidase
MAAILVVHATSHGQTARIAGRMAGRLTAAGHAVTSWNAEALPTAADPARFDACLLAGSIRFGRHQPALEAFARRHRTALAARPTAFVSVSGALMGTWAAAARTADGYVETFVKRTGWQPGRTATVAGAIRYTEYGLFTRLLMQVISRFTGRPTDTSRDWEGTDWEAVDRFADEWGRTVAPAPAVPA